MQDPKAVAEWERGGAGWGWAQLRWVLLSMVAAIAVFLFVTQPHLFNTTVGFVTAFGALVPVLLKLAGGLGGASRILND
ncbi:MAG: hypothetical protein GY953_02340 [bacterium]|nr:hypothetical protein [bacterium]